MRVRRAHKHIEGVPSWYTLQTDKFKPLRLGKGGNDKRLLIFSFRFVYEKSRLSEQKQKAL